MIIKKRKIEVLKRVGSIAPLLILISTALSIIWLDEKPIPVLKEKPQINSTCPFLSKK